MSGRWWPELPASQNRPLYSAKRLAAGNHRLIAWSRWSESLTPSSRCSKALVHDIPTCKELVEWMVAGAAEILECLRVACPSTRRSARSVLKMADSSWPCRASLLVSTLAPEEGGERR